MPLTLPAVLLQPSLLLFSTPSQPSQPAQPWCPIRDGSLVTTTRARSLAWGENDGRLVSQLGLVSWSSSPVANISHQYHCKDPQQPMQTNNGSLFLGFVIILIMATNILLGILLLLIPTSHHGLSNLRVIRYYGVFRLTGILAGQQKTHNFNPISSTASAPAPAADCLILFFSKATSLPLISLKSLK